MCSRKLIRSSVVLAAVTALPLVAKTAVAADVLWNNQTGNFVWDTTFPNFNGAVWNNAAIDGAIFGATGIGALSVPSKVIVDSIHFQSDGYSLNGLGTVEFGAGTSTQSTAVVNVAAAATAQIFNPIKSSVGFQKIGPGLLEISGANALAGGVPLTSNSKLVADVIVGSTSGTVNGGTLRVMNQSALPAATRVGIGTGYLDIGNNNITVSELIFTNQNSSAPWNTVLNANNGVIGSGTLRVTGEINVIGVNGLNAGNTIASNVDLGGGTQIVRVGLISSIGLNQALMFTGSLSNGSLLKTIGVTTAGIQGSIDGISLFGNNSYTGATILNSGSNVATGINQSSSIKMIGIPAGPAGSALTIQGANGSFPAASTIQVIGGASFVLDNNAAIGASGNNVPNIPAAQNNDRVRDDASIELRDSNFTYRGRTAVAATETFGSLNASGGNNIVTLTPNGGASVTVTGATNLSMASRATLVVNASGTGNTLGGNAQLKFNGSIPAADATGILPRIVTTADFLTYNAGTGFTPYTGYATDFSVADTNVSLAAASAVPTQTINALKRTGTFTTTLGATDTLSITSGMILNASGTGTITGGTIAFGNTPGVLFGGTTTVSSAITGTAGLIMPNGTGTLAGDMSGLSGTLNVHSSTVNLRTDTFTGPIQVRAGTLNLRVSQTGSGLSAITFGVPENDANLLGTVPTISLAGAGANAVFNRDLIVDNGAQTVAGEQLSFSLLPLLQPLNNNSGSQTWNGNVVLNSPLNLQGGAATGAVAGATVFTGNISGPAGFVIPNGRAIFSESSQVSNGGGFLIGNLGFTAQVSFLGQGSGNGPITINGGNNIQMKYKAGSLPGGPITIQRVGAATGAPTIFPLENSTINNQVVLNGTLFASVAAGIEATWAGPIDGLSPLAKTGDGMLIVTSNSSTHKGLTQVQAGTLRVNGTLPSGSIEILSGARLDGTGSAGGRVTAFGGATIAPGNSVGTLATGPLTVAGTLAAEIDLANGGTPAADLLDVLGSVDVSNGVLDVLLLNSPVSPAFAGGTYLLVANDDVDAVVGTFAAVTGIPNGYTGSVDYAFGGVDSLGRIGTGNDIALTVQPVPEPASFVAVAMAGILLRRRR